MVIDMAQSVDWGQAVLIFVLGIGTVFAVLILLWAILKLMKVVFYREPKPAAQPQQKAPAQLEPAATAATAATAEPAAADDSELVAVLTAAVACCLNTSTYNLKIRSYRKLGGPESVWNSVSRKENIENQL